MTTFRTLSPQRLLRTWRTAMSMVGTSTRRVIGISLLSLLRGLAEAGVLVAVARISIAIADDDANVRFDLGPLGVVSLSIGQALGVAAAAALAMLVLHVATARLSSKISAEALATARIRLANAFLDTAWDTQARERAGQLQEVLTTYAGRVLMAATQMTVVLTAAFNLTALLGTALIVDVAAAVAMILAVGGLGLILRPLTRVVRRQAIVNRDTNAAFAVRMTEVVGMAQEVKLLDVAAPVKAQIEAAATGASEAQRQATFLQGSIPGVYQSLAVLMVLGGLAVLTNTNQAGIATLSTVVLLLIRSISYGQQLQVGSNYLTEAVPYLRAMRDQEDLYRRNRRQSGDQPLASIDRLELSGVSYRYDEGEAALTDVSFVVEKGEVVGLVGPSGSGKSTLIQVLLRLRVPEGGRYLINGIDAEELSLSDWHRRLAVVPQQPHLFEASVADNIRFFRDHVEPSAVEDAARRAHVHEEILALPDGYDTVLRGVGSSVSGGQAQRLCIARALAGRPELLVLDEPTSALDVHSEELIQHALAELHGEVTMVVIAHRLSTLRLCNRIVVLDAGTILAVDTPECLERDNEYYRSAVQLSRRA